VFVDQPSVEDTISILRGLRERYEVHHGVASRTRRSSPPRCCPTRYITDRFLPDKAIDLVDEAAAKLRTEIDSLPTELDEASRRQIAAGDRSVRRLKKEKDPASRDRLERLEKELADVKAQADALRAQWQAEKQKVQQLRELREQIEQTRMQIEQATRKWRVGPAPRSCNTASCPSWSGV